MELLSMRKDYDKGWGDHCMALAAKIAKVFPYRADFLHCGPDFFRFSLFGGPFAHIHDVSRDNYYVSNNVYDFLDNMGNWADPENQKYSDKKFIAIFNDQASNKKIFKLMPHHSVINFIDNIECGIWSLNQKNELMLLLKFEDRLLFFNMRENGPGKLVSENIGEKNRVTKLEMSER